MASHWSLFALAAVLTGCLGDMSVDTLSVLYLPYAYNPRPKHELFSAAVEQIGFDPKTQMVYTIGGSGLLHVVDISEPQNATVVHWEHIVGVPNDIDVCGDFVAVSVRNHFQPLPGRAVIFRLYDPQTRTMERIHEIEVGASPASAIVFTRDCQTILVANEGEAGKDDQGRFIDPEGSVSIIKFGSPDLRGNITVTTADFRKYDERAERVERGIRWAYHGERSGAPTRLSQDIEPEYIVLSPDESIAYVGLQENNAIAHIDVAKAEVIGMFPLGFKDWSRCGLDASDKDGKINILQWPIRGLYQPDGMRLLQHGNRTLLVTANEGDAKKYKVKDAGITWADKARGRVFAEAGLLAESIPDEMILALKDDTKLGRLYFSLSDGRKDDTSPYEELYTFGGRGFSIWDAADLSLVYDSGADFEEYHAKYMPSMFNNHVGSRAHTPEEDFDARSDDNGPEVEIVETAKYDGKTYIFIGNQRVSSMMMYSLDDSSEDVLPQFEGIHRAGGRNQTWFKLFDEREVGDTNFQDMRYIAPEESPNGRPLLLVSGSLSGTLTVYEVNFPAPGSTPTPCTGTSIELNNQCALPPSIAPLESRVPDARTLPRR